MFKSLLPIVEACASVRALVDEGTLDVAIRLCKPLEIISIKLASYTTATTIANTNTKNLSERFVIYPCLRAQHIERNQVNPLENL